LSGLADLAVSTITQSQRRVEIAAQNIANATTPAYKRRVAFASLVRGATLGDVATSSVDAAIDFRAGQLSLTGRSSDFAIEGPGFFELRREDKTIYTRQAQFTVDRDGRLVDVQGYALQMTDGRDLVVAGSTFTVAGDGTVTEDGKAIGRIAMFAARDEHRLDPVNGGFRAAAGDMIYSDDLSVRQGALEASNVTLGDEMVGMMEALRRAEAGQRVMNVYDDLMGRVITTFGDNVR
jgi:flagellar basal-body rod protein FlgF